MLPSMKRAVLFVLLALAVFGISFIVVWNIVHRFAQNAPALEVAAAGLACAISLATTRHIVRDLMDEPGKR